MSSDLRSALPGPVRRLRRAVGRLPGAWPAYVALRRALWEGRAAFHGLRMGRAATRLRALVAADGPRDQTPSARAPLPASARTILAPVPPAEAARCARTAHVLAEAGAGARLLDWREHAGATEFVVDGDPPPGASERTAEMLRAGRLVERRGAPADAPAFARYALADHRAELARVLDAEGTRRLHFGREYRLRGGRYLYQSVPELGRGGRRDTLRRWRLISERLDALDLGVRDRLVLDVGCNAGMMLGAALADGAAFGVGWDRPEIAELGRRLLGGLGYTRFALVGADLGEHHRLAPDVPPGPAALLDGCVVLYLAIRHHVGFVADLADLPWRVLVYEGGEEETAGALETTLAPLRERCAFTIADRRDYRDGEGRPRPLAVLVR